MGKFSNVHNRKNTRSIKWDLMQKIFNTEDALPMWIADMDFQVPKEINKAIIDRAKHGIYGYTMTDDQLLSTITTWVQKRHNWTINNHDISFSPSVVTSLHMAITAFTKPKDRVLIQTPVYTPFFQIIKQHDREIATNELILNEKTNKYEIDFVHFEEMLASRVKAFILCSPHNPVGRVWTKQELTKMAKLCRKYNVLILSDEIHADLIYDPYTHIPIASISPEISENTLTFMSPSKTFNIAGLQASYAITKNSHLRTKFRNQLQKFGLSNLNTFGIYALEAAYHHGEGWLDKLLKTLEENKNYVQSEFETHLPNIRVIDAEGTYLLWLDCRNLQMNDEQLDDFFIHKANVALNKGVNYGDEGKQFMRINIACPPKLLQKGVTQIIQAINNIKS